MDIAEIVLVLFERRRGAQDSVGAVALDRDVSVSPGAFADDALHVGKIVDRAAVDGGDQIAWLEAGRCSRAVGLNRVDPRAHGLLAVKHEHAGENHDSQ